MSWSVSAVGKAAAVALAAAKQFDAITCSEPEQSIKNLVGSAVATALAAFPDDYVVEVLASGSQSDQDYGKPDDQKTGKKTNQLSVSIKPIWGFIE